MMLRSAVNRAFPPPASTGMVVCLETKCTISIRNASGHSFASFNNSWGVTHSFYWSSPTRLLCTMLEYSVETRAFCYRSSPRLAEITTHFLATPLLSHHPSRSRHCALLYEGGPRMPIRCSQVTSLNSCRCPRRSAEGPTGESVICWVGCLLVAHPFDHPSPPQFTFCSIWKCGRLWGSSTCSIRSLAQFIHVICGLLWLALLLLGGEYRPPSEIVGCQ